MRIDSHHHFWQLERGDYHWLSDELSAIYKSFLPEDLAPLLKKNGIDKTIIVQAAETVAESEYILKLAEQTDYVAGVVAWVNMEDAASVEQLELWANHPYFLGIRPVIQDIEDVDWMLKPELAPCFEWLVKHDFSFDALVLPQHLKNLLTLVDRYPSLRVVIDHGAKPHIKSQRFQPWADDMAALAHRPQLHCKLSGLVTEAGKLVNFDSLLPYMQHLYKCFGANRLMWGSDWPVCTLAATYDEWVDLSHQYIKTLSTEAQRKILGETALHFYRPRALEGEIAY